MEGKVTGEINGKHQTKKHLNRNTPVVVKNKYA